MSSGTLKLTSRYRHLTLLPIVLLRFNDVNLIYGEHKLLRTNSCMYNQNKYDIV